MRIPGPVVVGLGFGDEGKGCTVDWLCSLAPRPPLVVRYSGGAQAGHHVRHKDKSHVFSHFGSGTLRGAKTAWMPACPVDPVALMGEYDILLGKGVSPTIYIHEDCQVVTPMEYQANKAREADTLHGTCGAGILETRKRREAGYSIRAGDLAFPSVLRHKLELARTRFYGYTDAVWGSGLFFEAVDRMLSCPDVQVVPDLGRMASYTEGVLYEGSQGLMLDQDYGFFPHCTPSSLGRKAAPGNGPAYYVTRAYQTRHGAGPMLENDIGPSAFQVDNPDETNQDANIQGRFRKRMLDTELLRYALHRDGGAFSMDTLVVTCLEHLPLPWFFHEGRVVECGDGGDMAERLADILGFRKVVACANHEFKRIR